MARMTQMEKVVSFMTRNGEITQRDAYKMGVYRLADVIFRMKKPENGYIVRTETRCVTNMDGSKSYIAVYSFPKDDDGNMLLLPFER